MSRKAKRWIKIGALMLCMCAALVFIGHISKGFQELDPTEWKLQEVNQENLYQSFTFAADETLCNGANGITAVLTEDNAVIVNGTAETEENIVVGSYTLKAGTEYVFGSNLDNGTNKTVYIELVDVSTGVSVAKLYNSSVKILAADADRSVELRIHVAAEAGINNLELRPVLSAGANVDDLVAFYK